MRLKDIETTGVWYHNGKKGWRKTTGEARPLFSSQEDCDCIAYVQVNRTHTVSAGFRFFQRSDCTRRAFASWAKRRATDEEASKLDSFLSCHEVTRG